MTDERMRRVFTSFDTYDPAILTPAEEKQLLQITTEAEAWAVVGDIKYLTAESLALIDQRAEEWHKLFPMGEPMCSRKDGYQFYLYSVDITDALPISLRQAQRMLQITRLKLNKEKGDFVSVKEFCHINHLDEQVFREALNALK